MDQIRWPARFHLVPTCPKSRNQSRFWKFFPRKNQRDISALISQRHSIGKGSLPCHPSDIHTSLGIDPCAAHVKWFMTKRLHHCVEFAFGSCPRAICNEADDSWQFWIS